MNCGRLDDSPEAKGPARLICITMSSLLDRRDTEVLSVLMVDVDEVRLSTLAL